MKINHPVTDTEVHMKKGTILVTRTNLKGVITYANDAFVDISGFSREELIGSNHNIVRHPDMPPAAFEDLWKTLKKGDPWTACVKNRTKNGDYYWVEANVIPVYEDGKISEYLSARYAPSREQIRQAEDLYAKLNAKEVEMRPKGLALLMKRLSEMSVKKKSLAIAIGFLIPAFFFMYQLFQQQNYPILGGVALLTLAASWMGYRLIKLFDDTLETTIGISYALAGGYYRNKFDLNRLDQIGDFKRSLYAMQVKLNSDLAFSKETANASSRVKQALDQVTGNVMMADANYDIIYMNESAKKLFKRNEQDFRKDLPEFNADTLIGTNIDIFHKNPAHQRSMLDNLKQTLEAEMLIGGRHMKVIATPVIDGDVRLGTAVEWIDRTNEVRVQNEIDNIVNQVKAGELSSRIDMADKEGFFAVLSNGINDLADVVEQVINEIAYVMSGVAEGDLTREINKNYQGTFATCKEDINTSLNKLSSVFIQVLEASNFINNSSQEIASGNNNLSQRAEQQAANLEQTASSMEQLTSTVKNNSDNAQQANRLANDARDLAEQGGGVVNSAVSAMQEINESSNKIADIIGVIDEIAFQTNLLALNASVEAARAGEQGRGFSVVATEVRNLAQRSATAARESKELIQNSVQKVRTGTEFVNETGQSLDQIVSGVKKVGDIVAEIAAASAEQSAGIGQVNQAVAQMDEITQQNAALAEQASAASVSMSDQTNNMAQLLAFFKVASGGGQMASAPTASPVNAPAASSGGVVERVAEAKASGQTGASMSNDFSSSHDDEWEEF